MMSRPSKPLVQPQSLTTPASCGLLCSQPSIYCLNHHLLVHLLHFIAFYLSVWKHVSLKYEKFLVYLICNHFCIFQKALNANSILTSFFIITFPTETITKNKGKKCSLINKNNELCKKHKENNNDLLFTLHFRSLCIHIIMSL